MTAPGLRGAPPQTDAAPRGALRAWGWSALAVAAAALVASVTSLGNGFALDDVLIIEGRPLLHSLADPWRLLTTAYWQLPPDDTLWRPLGLLTFAMQWVLGGGAPWVFHAVSIALYVGTAVLTLAVARELLPPLGALAAGVVFAVHPVHAESVGNVVGQLELWVAMACLAATLLYLRARRRGPLGPAAILGVLACFVLGLGMKEHAILLPGFLLAAELTVLRADRPRGEDARRLRYLLYGLVVVAALWLSVRSGIVGGLAGDRAHVALRGLGLWERSWVMLALVPEFVRLFLWPARLYADYSPQFVTLAPAPALVHLPGALLVAAFIAALAWSWRRAPALAFGLLLVPVALALVANIVVPTGILMAERTLYLATIGVALAAGAVVAALLPRVQGLAPLVRTSVAAAGLAVLALGAAHSAERQQAWKSNETLIASLVVDAPTNFRGHFWLGDELMRRGDLVAGETALRRAMALWPAHDGPPLALALRYQERGLCEPALMLYETARRLEPRKPTPYFGASGCLMALGRLRAARTMAFEGLATGRSARAFRYLIVQADSALAATDSLTSNNWWVRGRREAIPLVPQVTNGSAGP